MRRTKTAIALCYLLLLALIWPAGHLLACRDLETGTFLTRDPAGMVDGPNLYTYVNQNPWTKFDPEGLASALRRWDHLFHGEFGAAAMDAPLLGPSSFNDVRGLASLPSAIAEGAGRTAAVNKGDEALAATGYAVSEISGANRLLDGVSQSGFAIDGDGKASRSPLSQRESVLRAVEGGEQLVGSALGLKALGSEVGGKSARSTSVESQEAATVPSTESTGAKSFGPGAAHIDDPVFISSNQARLQAMRDAGIPTSQQPVSQTRTDAGRQYIYDVNEKQLAVTQQTTDRPADHGPHWEAGNVKPASDYGLDPFGRARVFNQGKVKVNYGK